MPQLLCACAAVHVRSEAEAASLEALERGVASWARVAALVSFEGEDGSTQRMKEVLLLCKAAGELPPNPLPW